MATKKVYGMTMKKNLLGRAASALTKKDWGISEKLGIPTKRTVITSSEENISEPGGQSQVSQPREQIIGNSNYSFPAAQKEQVQDRGSIPSDKPVSSIRSTANSNNVKAPKNPADDAEKEARKLLDMRMEAIGKKRNLGFENIDSLMSELDPRYQLQQDQFQKTLDTNRQGDINSLAAQMAAYGTADSEQRVQAEERLRTDYSGRLADFLAELGSKKNSERTTLQNSRRDIEANSYDDEVAAETDIYSILERAKQQKFENDNTMAQLAASKSRGGGAGTSFKKNSTPAATRAQQLKGQFQGDWDKIANVMTEEGYDMMPGSEDSAAVDWIVGGTTQQPTVKPKRLGANQYGEDIFIDENTGEPIVWQQ